MNYKSTIGIYFVIICVLVLIYLSFINFYVLLINKSVDIISNPFLVSVEVAESEVTFCGTEVDSVELPLLPLSEIDSNYVLVDENEDEEVKGNGYVGYKSISAYNAGDINQCQGDPCISASGDNICELLRKGTNVCAANWVSFGTVLEIESLGKCIVLDRMPNANNVDWAMRKDRVAEAFDFGRRNLRVWVIN